ncbi:hypothetical protein DTO96_100466 [Ephemeroptericola cinctiostellae]|uniref:Uncharacterized protein n=1 Tax=Ephemeroptericola cinctiostellae TaxID=2268024 RepID=A0A345D8R8_9BURK|nr:hypothetical protein [Ephemeroptericola cinctiostellae]AXF84756.1 hypothetical protein DTO96_100466 [Ephemeroptericola cinctiostellae]
MKTNSSHSSLPHGRQGGGLILNVGIGVVLGLLAALLAVFLVMKGGPFKDHANTNTIAPQTGQAADPNTPLYGAPVQPIDPAANKAATNSGGEGVGALTGNSSITDTTPTPAVKSATKETAKPVATPSSDPVAAMINAATGNKTAIPPPEKKAAVKAEPAPDAKPAPKPTTSDIKPTPATDSKPKVNTSGTTSNSSTATTKTAAAPAKEVKPTQKTTTKATTVKSSSLPKEVKPATAP